MALRVNDPYLGDKIGKILDELEKNNESYIDSDDESISSEQNDNLEIEDEYQSDEDVEGHENSEGPNNENANAVTEGESIIIPSNASLKGKNLHIWSSIPPKFLASRTSSRNIIHIIPEPTTVTKCAENPNDAFLFL